MNVDCYEQIAQMFLVGIPDKKCIPDVLQLIKNYSIGGVLIYRNNFENFKELKELIDKLYKANKKNRLPLFIAIDEEGGRVNRLPKEFKNIPSAYKIGKFDNERIETLYDTLNKTLSLMGFNMNLAPVLDLKVYENSHYIGDRAFSSTPKRVAEVADIVIKSSVSNNIIPVAKHFPGLGNVKLDSHLFLPKLSNYQKDIIPFKHIIKNGCDAILLAHLRLKGKSGLYPASLSRKFIQKELRDKFNYNGLIITDELRMRSIRFIYGSKRAIKLAINAGNDILCCKYHNHNIEKYIKMIGRLADKGKYDLRSNYQRIKDYKEKYNLKDISDFSKIDIDKYNKKISCLCDEDVK